MLVETLAALSRPYFRIRPCWFEQTRKSEHPGRIFSDGSSGAAGDPCCFLGCKEAKGRGFFPSVFQDHLYLFSVCLFCLFFYWFVRLSSQFLWALNVIRKIDVFVVISYKKFPYRNESPHTGRKRLIL